MIQITPVVNTQILLTLLNPGGSGQPNPTDMKLLKDGVVVTTPTVTIADLGVQGLYNFTFTPQSTGVYVLYAYGAIQARIEVISRSVFSYLQNIEDESIGSWRWDKVAGTLSMLRQDGTALASFTVIDNLTEASRERTT